jgi:hypothetical protein
MLGRCSITSAIPPFLFALAVFQIGSCIFAQAELDHGPPIYTSHIPGMTGEYPMPSLLVEMGSH